MPEHGWVFLHAGGAVGADGPVPGIEVDVPATLRQFCLPRAGTTGTREALQRSLAFVEIAPPAQTWPVLAAAVTALLEEVLSIGVTVWLYGESGSRKTTAALLVSNHFGAFRDMRDVLLASSNREFFTRHHYAEGRFECDDSGRVARLVIKEGAHELVARRSLPIAP